MWLYRLTHVMGPALGLYWRLSLTGREHVPPGGGYIVAANHGSFIDPWLLGIAFPARSMRFGITAEWYRRTRLMRRFFDAYGAIEVKDGRGPEVIEELKNVVESGDRLAIFPEGRVTHDGHLQRFRLGTAHLAEITRAPVLPVAICGNYRTLPRHRRVPRPSRVVVRVVKPLRYHDMHEEGDRSRDTAKRFLDELRARIAHLLAEGPANVLAPPS